MTNIKKFIWDDSPVRRYAAVRVAETRLGIVWCNKISLQDFKRAILAERKTEKQTLIIKNK